MNRPFRLPDHILTSIAAGERVDDFEFDEIFPAHIKEISDVHWSPVEIAKTIACYMEDYPGAKLLDVGSGPGKLCLFLALSTELEIHGVEQRENLARIAEDICEANAPGRVRIIHGNMLDIHWPDYDAFYLYNPFQEHRLGAFQNNVVDKQLKFSRKTFSKYTSEVYRQLSLLRPGQRVITYYGYGGKIPSALKLMKKSKIGRGTLCMWERP